MAKRQDLAQHTYLLTGASRGIGAQIARTLASQGVKVIAVARNRVALNAISAEVQAQGNGQVIPVEFDLTNRDQIDHWVQNLWSTYGPFNGVIHNAGIDDFQASEHMTKEALTHQIDLNLTAPLLINRSLLPHFLKQDQGSFIHMNSVAGYIPAPFGAVYSATKSALWSYNEALAIEYAHTPLCFVSIHPGFVHGTGMHERHKATAGTAPAILGGTSDQEVVNAVLQALTNIPKSQSIIVNRFPVRPFLLLIHAVPSLGRSILRKLAAPYMSRVAQAHRQKDDEQSSDLYQSSGNESRLETK